MGNRDEALKLRREGLTYAEIGTRLGLSRQRVHQLVTTVLAWKSERTCPVCGTRFDPMTKWQKFDGATCRQRAHRGKGQKHEKA